MKITQKTAGMFILFYLFIFFIFFFIIIIFFFFFFLLKHAPDQYIKLWEIGANPTLYSNPWKKKLP